jgi:hypothetical protein
VKPGAYPENARIFDQVLAAIVRNANESILKIETLPFKKAERSRI